jgi:hypothetical protein
MHMVQEGPRGGLWPAFVRAYRRGRGEAMAGRRRLVPGHQAGEGPALGLELERGQLQHGEATEELQRRARQRNGRHPWRHQGTPVERIGEGPAKASKVVALVAWPWLCSHARASGSPEPRRNHARHCGTRKKGKATAVAGCDGEAAKGSCRRLTEVNSGTSQPSSYLPTWYLLGQDHSA